MNNKILPIREASLIIQGTIHIKEESSFGAEVELLWNGEKTKSIIISLDGFFSFQLKYNTHYSIIINKPNYYNKRVDFDTTIHSITNNRFYRFDIDLLESIHQIPVEVINKPIAIIQYNKEYNSFSFMHNEKYTSNILKELSKYQNKVA